MFDDFQIEMRIIQIVIFHKFTIDVNRANTY